MKISAFHKRNCSLDANKTSNNSISQFDLKNLATTYSLNAETKNNISNSLEKVKNSLDLKLSYVPNLCTQNSFTNSEEKFQKNLFSSSHDNYTNQIKIFKTESVLGNSCQTDLNLYKFNLEKEKESIINELFGINSPTLISKNDISIKFSPLKNSIEYCKPYNLDEYYFISASDIDYSNVIQRIDFFINMADYCLINSKNIKNN